MYFPVAPKFPMPTIAVSSPTVTTPAARLALPAVFKTASPEAGKMPAVTPGGGYKPAAPTMVMPAITAAAPTAVPAGPVVKSSGEVSAQVAAPASGPNWLLWGALAAAGAWYVYKR